MGINEIIDKSIKFDKMDYLTGNPLQEPQEWRGPSSRGEDPAKMSNYVCFIPKKASKP